MSLATSQGRSFRWMIIFKIIGWVAAFFMGIAVVRHFSSDANKNWLGKLAYFNAVVFPVTLFGANWINFGYVKFLNQERKNVAEIFWTTFVLKFSFSFFLACVGISFLIVFDFELEKAEVKILVLAMATNILLSSLGLAAVFDSWKKSAYEVFCKTVTNFMYVAIIFWLLFVENIQEGDIWWIPAAECATTLIYILGLIFVFHYKISPLRFSPSKKRAKDLIRFGSPMIFSGLSEKLPGNADTILLGSIFGPQGDLYCALYSIPQRILKYTREFMKLTVRQLTPEIMRRYAVDSQESSKLFLLSFNVVGLIALCFGTILSLFSKEIIIALFSFEFVDSSDCLIFLMGAFCFRYLTKICNVLLVSAGMNKRFAINQYCMGVAAVIILCVCVPLWKYRGAALGMMLIYLFTLVLSWLSIRHILHVSYRPNFLKLLLPALLTSVVIIVAKHYLASEITSELIFLLCGLTSAFVLYISLSWYLGPLNSHHKAKIEEALIGFVRSKRVGS